jgi:hypothetical protein
MAGFWNHGDEPLGFIKAANYTDFLSTSHGEACTLESEVTEERELVK